MLLYIEMFYFTVSQKDVSTLEKNDSQVLTTQLNEDNNTIDKDTIGNVDIDEMLIYYVSKRRPLYDHRLPVSQRTNLKKMHYGVKSLI